MDRSNIATGWGKLHIDMVTWASRINISVLITQTERQHEGREQVKTYCESSTCQLLLMYNTGGEAHEGK